MLCGFHKLSLQDGWSNVQKHTHTGTWECVCTLLYTYPDLPSNSRTVTCSNHAPFLSHDPFSSLQTTRSTNCWSGWRSRNLSEPREGERSHTYHKLTAMCCLPKEKLSLHLSNVLHLVFYPSSLTPRPFL